MGHRLPRRRFCLHCGLALPSIQSNAFSQAAAHSLSLDSWVAGFIYTVLVSYVVLGGGRRIASTAEKIVPFMAIAYIILAFVILGTCLVQAEKTVVRRFGPRRIFPKILSMFMIL